MTNLASPVTYFSDKQVAAKLGLSLQCVQKWRHKRIGPPWLRLCGAVRYASDALDRWLLAQTVTTTEQVA